MAAVDVANHVGIGFQHHIFVDQPRAGDGRAAGVDSALNAVFARPGHHLFGLVADLDRAQAHLTQERDTRLRQVFKVLLDHALFNHGRTRNHFHAAGAKVVKRALCGDGQRF